MQNWEMKQYLIISGKKSLSKALKQALMLEAVKAAAEPPMRPQEVKTKALMGTMLPVTERSMTGHILCLQCGSTGHHRRGHQQRPDEATGQDSGK
jgi:hypothetical protein